MSDDLNKEQLISLYEEMVKNSKYGHDEYGRAVIIQERSWDKFVRFMAGWRLGISTEGQQP